MRRLENIIQEITNREIDKLANQADKHPTDAQKESGNYRKGHVTIKGFKISIENPKGSRRYYDGGKKYNVMKNHYGYFNNAMGYDGDQVDVFLGRNMDFDKVYVIDQKKQDGSFDESKVMMGFSSKEEAKKAYMSNYTPDWKGFMAITEVGIEEFRKWLYSGTKQKKAFSEYKNLKENKMAKNVIKLNESDIENLVRNAVHKVINESKTKAWLEKIHPEWERDDYVDDFVDDSDYDKEMMQSPKLSDEDLDRMYFETAQNSIGDDPNVDADGVGDEYEYLEGKKYAENLIAKSKDTDSIVRELLAKEENDELSIFEQGMLDVLDGEGF